MGQTISQKILARASGRSIGTPGVALPRSWTCTAPASFAPFLLTAASVARFSSSSGEKPGGNATSFVPS